MTSHVPLIPKLTDTLGGLQLRDAPGRYGVARSPAFVLQQIEQMDGVWMILNVDLSSEVPIYQQLRDQIVEAIAEGVLTEGSSLPTTRALAADFGINFHTVNKAYDLLRQQGLIRLNRKTGGVVTPMAADASFHEEWTARARTLLAEAIARGVPADEVLTTCRTVLDSFDATQREDTP